MNDNLFERQNYDAPCAVIVLFPEQDIVTNSGGIELPDDEW